MMGLVPGVAALVSGRMRAGVPYMILGLTTLVCALLLGTGYASTQETIRELRIQPRFILFHAAAIWTLVAIYELLRFGASLEEGPEHASRTPRLLATFWIPAVLLLIAGPAFVGHAPRIVESAWFASIIVVLGAAPAVVWCTFSDLLQDDPERKRTFWLLTASALALLFVVAVWLVFGFGDAWAKSAANAGFQLLPRILD